FQTAQQEQEWIVPHGNRHRAGLTTLPVFVADETAVLARGDVESKRLFVVHRDAVRSRVDPTGIGVAADDDVARAQVSATVTGVPDRGGKTGEIDLFLHLAILED